MLILVTVLAVVLIVVGVGLAVGELRGRPFAERRASDFLSARFGNPVVVRAEERPFVTQALRGRYSAVTVSGADLRMGELTGVALDARLRNVHLSLRELLGRRVTEVPCEEVRGHVVVPYAELARVARIPGLRLRLDGKGRLLADAAVPVPGISQLVRITGEARLAVADTDTVWLRIRGVTVIGIALPQMVLAQLLPTLNVPVRLPRLPFGLRIDELRPTPAGLEVAGSAQAVVFGPGGSPPGRGPGGRGPAGPTPAGPTPAG